MAQKDQFNAQKIKKNNGVAILVKKRHGAKTVVMSNNLLEVKVLTPIDPGSKHDKKIRGPHGDAGPGR